ncbi:MAG TPA: antibiotic biosynthesis monooxygenase [Nitrospiria bacterium]|nr:antibiotic biosynthesis monooxygenase [Nitrospiria bacterium]
MTGETSRHVYRVDQFVVPDSAREEFLGKVRGTHRLLKAQPGFVRDVVLEQTAGPGRFNFVTLVEWRSQSAMDAAKAVVTAAHAKSGFNPQELFARLGIQADIANYTAIDA